MTKSKNSYKKIQLYFSTGNTEEMKLWKKLESLDKIGRTKQGAIKEILYNHLVENAKEEVQKKKIIYENDKDKISDEENFVNEFKKFNE